MHFYLKGNGMIDPGSWAEAALSHFYLIFFHLMMCRHVAFKHIASPAKTFYLQKIEYVPEVDGQAR